LVLPEEVKEMLIGILLGEDYFCISGKILEFKSLFCLRKILKLYFRVIFLCLELCDLSDFTTMGYYKDGCYLITSSVLFYSNAELHKTSILAENKGKSGIYLWTNKVNGKCYVGSSVDMGKRFRNYFKRSYITSLKNIMLVYKAILAHGYSNFSLEILEYCEPDKIIILEREQYYLDLVFWIFLWASPKKKKENPNTIS
jgi:hypothetical protein